jgi:hypothetical protein
MVAGHFHAGAPDFRPISIRWRGDFAVIELLAAAFCCGGGIDFLQGVRCLLPKSVTSAAEAYWIG